MEDIMTFFNSKAFGAILIVLGIAFIGFGIFSFISPELNSYMNVIMPVSLGCISLGLCSAVGGFMMTGFRRLTLVFYIPFIFVASAFFALLAHQIIF